MSSQSLAILFLALLMAPSVRAQENSGRIQAKFLSSLGASGSALELLQPQQIRYDRRHQELYLCDTGNNRIAILDSRGFYIYDFSHADILRAPTDLAVDREGMIYILGSFAEGSYLHVFDYNGEYLRPFRFLNGPDPNTTAIISMVIDSSNAFYMLDGKGVRVLAYDLSGNFISEFPILPEAQEQRRAEPILSGLYLCNDLLCIPAPLLGSVLCYTKNGSLSKMIGHTGGGYGELSFPVAVAQDAMGNFLVLDKHRSLVVSYDPSGKVKGEIGGLGTQPGWFYHPIAMLVDARNRLWVAQGLNNWVQVFQLPEPVQPAPATPEQPVVVDD